LSSVQEVVEAIRDLTDRFSERLHSLPTYQLDGEERMAAPKIGFSEISDRGVVTMIFDLWVSDENIRPLGIPYGLYSTRLRVQEDAHRDYMKQFPLAYAYFSSHPADPRDPDDELIDD